MSVDELRSSLAGLQVLDVRRRSEYDSGHVPNAVNVPLDFFEERAGEIDLSKPTAIICASGYRSSTAASLLRGPGIVNITGGTAAWIAAGYETA
jgi:hydroxyacylglutathione hydrolase